MPCLLPDREVFRSKQWRHTIRKCRVGPCFCETLETTNKVAWISPLDRLHSLGRTLVFAHLNSKVNHPFGEQIAREFAEAALPPPPPDDNVALFPVCSTVKVAEYNFVHTYLAKPLWNPLCIRVSRKTRYPFDFSFPLPWLWLCPNSCRLFNHRLKRVDWMNASHCKSDWRRQGGGTLQIFITGWIFTRSSVRTVISSITSS